MFQIEDERTIKLIHKMKFYIDKIKADNKRLKEKLNLCLLK